MKSIPDDEIHERSLLGDKGSEVIAQLGILNTAIPEGRPAHGVAYPGWFLVDERGVVAQRRFYANHAVRESPVAVLRDAGAPLPAEPPDGATRPGKHATARAWLDSPTYRTGQIVGLTVELKIADGWHVYGEPLPEGFFHVPPGDFEALNAAVSDKTCAIMLEPILGEGGVVVLPDTFLQKVRELCDERDILLIMDEIQAGMGRTGRPFAHQWAGITPDIMTLAKALGGGLPIGAMLAREKYAPILSAGSHGTTFGGNPVACSISR
jgi:hypothetical protein